MRVDGGEWMQQQVGQSRLLPRAVHRARLSPRHTRVVSQSGQSGWLCWASKAPLEKGSPASQAAAAQTFLAYCCSFSRTGGQSLRRIRYHKLVTKPYSTNAIMADEYPPLSWLTD